MKSHCLIFSQNLFLAFLVLILVIILGVSPTLGKPPVQSPSPSQLQAIDHLAQGWQYYYQGNTDEALNEFIEVTRLASDWAEGYVGTAIAYMELGDYASANISFSQALMFEDDDAYLYQARAEVNFYTGNTLQAIDDATRSIKLNDTNASAYNNRAHFHQQNQAYREAEKDFLQAILTDPAEPHYWDSLREFYKLIENEGGFTFTNLMSLGFGYLEEGDNRAARLKFYQALNFNYSRPAPHSELFIGALYNLALVYFADGDTERALQNITAATLRNSYFARGFLQRAEIQLANGFTSQALGSYSRALAANPEYGPIYLSQGNFYVDEGDTRQAGKNFLLWFQHSQLRDIEWNAYELGQTFRVNLGQYWVYNIPFWGQANQQLSIRVEQNSSAQSDVDPLIVLVGPNGQVVTANNNTNSGTLTASLENIVLATEGEYQIWVGNASTTYGLVDITIDGGPVLSDINLTTTAQAYTPTSTPSATSTPTIRPTRTVTPTPTSTSTPRPTRTSTSTPTMTYTPSITPTASDTLTPTVTFTSSPTVNSSIIEFKYLGEFGNSSTGGEGWIDGTQFLYALPYDEIKVASIIEAYSPHTIASFEFATTGATSPNGRLFAYGNDGIMNIVDTRTGETLASLRGHSSYLGDLDFSANSFTMVSVASGSVIVWDMFELKQITSFRSSYGNSVAISPNGKIIAVNDRGQLTSIYRLVDGRILEIKTFGEYGFSQNLGINRQHILDFSPDGTILARASGDTIFFYETLNFREIGQLSGHTNTINGIDFNADGTLLASASDDGTVRIWSLTEMVEIEKLNHMSRMPVGVKFNPQNNLLLVTYYLDSLQIFGSKNFLETLKPIVGPMAHSSNK